MSNASQNIASVFQSVRQKGFTIPELIIVVTVFGSLLLLATINLINVKQKASLNSATDVFIAEIREQQLKAMVGDTERTGTKYDYGVHFESNAYIFFRGATYNASDPTNFDRELEDNITFVSFPTDIIFSRVSGETLGGSTSIVLRDEATGEQHIVQINELGVITDLN